MRQVRACAMFFVLWACAALGCPKPPADDTAPVVSGGTAPDGSTGTEEAEAAAGDGTSMQGLFSGSGGFDGGTTGTTGTGTTGAMIGLTTGFGGLSRESILEVVRGGRADLRRCYESALLGDANLAGRVVVSFIISPSGEVDSADAVGNTGGRRAGGVRPRAGAGMSFPRSDEPRR